ncbi:MAG: hypothetical protein RBR41_02455 [Desulfovibrio sp.]|uniref:hypothetical protein n=1 Tax=Desulfovibrio sp. TaxID=885 RepID=UPI002A359209|nr:hypothetical protein [Desulfovibrio sp.]MDY0258513.1 hypothetical protein [Desulfovibrio sp.]
MSVDNTPTGIVYTVTNGAAGQQYPLTFPYIKDDDVRAYYVYCGTQVTMSLGPGYSVSGQTLTANTALPVGAKLAIYRETDITQEIPWVDGQAVYTPDIMQADDKLTFIVQEIAGEVKRAVKVSREEEAGGSTPGDLLAGVYAARDEAQNAGRAAHASETAAEQSATNAAASANTAAQTVQTATAEAVNAATAQADSAALSAAAAAQSAIDAAAAVPEHLVQRVTDVEATAAAAKAITDTVTVTPAPNAVPLAGSDGKLAVGWIPGLFRGDIRLLPFAPADLATYCPGWYCGNGDLYPLISAVGIELNAFSTAFKTAWGIVITGSNISIPKLFYTNGRGFFLRAVDGTTRVVGSVQVDMFASHTHTYNSGPGNYLRDGSIAVPFFTDSQTGATGGEETRPLNVGMTPAIFLGV